MPLTHDHSCKLEEALVRDDYWLFKQLLDEYREVIDHVTMGDILGSVLENGKSIPKRFLVLLLHHYLGLDTSSERLPRCGLFWKSEFWNCAFIMDVMNQQLHPEFLNKEVLDVALLLYFGIPQKSGYMVPVKERTRTILDTCLNWNDRDSTKNGDLTRWELLELWQTGSGLYGICLWKSVLDTHLRCGYHCYGCCQLECVCSYNLNWKNKPRSLQLRVYLVMMLSQSITQKDYDTFSSCFDDECYDECYEEYYTQEENLERRFGELSGVANTMLRQIEAHELSQLASLDNLLPNMFQRIHQECVETVLSFILPTTQQHYADAEIAMAYWSDRDTVYG